MRITSFALLAGCLFWSSQVGRLKFVAIQEPLVISSQKNSPPHVAFDEVFLSQRDSTTEWSKAEKSEITHLEANKFDFNFANSRKILLTEMIVEKNKEIIVADVKARADNIDGDEADSNTWINELPLRQAKRLQEAQRRSDVLSEKWSPDLIGDSVSEKANQLVKNEVKTLPPEQDLKQKLIIGPLEITGGLAVTNEHHIEIRRRVEGIVKELGRVDLQQGTYKIQVEEPTGSVVAQLVDKNGRVVGEGSYRLNYMIQAQLSANQQGPKIKIQPQPSYSGVVVSAYNHRPSDEAPPQTRATFVKGAADVMARSNGLIAMDNVNKGSTTVMRVSAPGHLQTNAIVVAGEQFRAQLFPESMIAALRDIVTQQRDFEINDAAGIVWGRVVLDGKPLSGIDVSMESQIELIPIYFNELMLPDASLQKTSSNGLFAFVDVKEGFHSLIAMRENSILGYQNIVAEIGAVSQTELAGTIRTQAVPLKTYDAFTGEPKATLVSMQSLNSEIELGEGTKTIELPNTNRLGMVKVQPNGNDYLSARYFYNDQDEFIHIPLVRWSWISKIKSFLRIEDKPISGVVVGFVPDEDFEVYIAGHDEFDSKQIVFFDMQGRVLQGRNGMAGGGFIIYNVPVDAQEIIVLGARTQKIYSRLIPVDPGSLSVLSIH